MIEHRTCRYGHGALELLAGWFSLAGVNLSEGNALEAIAGKRRIASPNEQLLALRVWRCPECGYVELVDPPRKT